MTKKLHPREFKVLDAGTLPSVNEDWICVEVAPGYICDLHITYDDQGPYALPYLCGDGEGYIRRADSLSRMSASTAFEVSDEDIWLVEDFAEHYYDTHPEKFDGEH